MSSTNGSAGCFVYHYDELLELLIFKEVDTQKKTRAL
jgi:hypothetical protein